MLRWNPMCPRTAAETTSLGYGLGRQIVNILAVLVFFVALPARAGDERPLTILALGDSLTAGYGLDHGQGFTAQLQRAVDDAGLNARIINAGVSGDTSAGGRARLDWLLTDEVDAVIVELGANDGLRGLDPAETRANLEWILARLAEKNRPVLLTGMLAPPNLGADYGAEFNAIYPDLARKYAVIFDPFFLEGVAADPALNQRDGIHPNADGVAIIVKQLLPHVRELIARARAQRNTAPSQ